MNKKKKIKDFDFAAVIPCLNEEKNYWDNDKEY